MKKKPIIEIKVNSWNKRTPKEQTEAFLWLYGLMADLIGIYRDKGISNDFTGRSK
jgi:hypothetical protein